jgi:hypothetical protein
LIGVTLCSCPLRAYLERALAWQGTLDRHYANVAGLS